MPPHTSYMLFCFSCYLVWSFYSLSCWLSRFVSQHKLNLLRQISSDHTSEYLFLLSACLSGQICPAKHQGWWWGPVESILKEGPRTKVFPPLRGNERKNLVWMELGNENYFCLGLLRQKNRTFMCRHHTDLRNYGCSCWWPRKDPHTNISARKIR